VVEELMLFESHCMLPLLRTLIFIVDRMKAQRVVWGVGRGSSCSSYLLYLIGLHNVDPVKYDVSIRDFIRDED
jgi:DNA polymerase III alpha subunit